MGKGVGREKGKFDGVRIPKDSININSEIKSIFERN